MAAIPAARTWLAERQVDYMRVDGRSYGLPEIAELLDGARCGHLCGTYLANLVDPLTLYRRSRDRLARGFFLRDDVSGESIGSDRGPVEVEVSVVVPAYKVSAELDRCLASLAAQTLEKLEVVVVDDGSPDDSGAKADAWAARHPGRIKVIHKPNGGCASARMAGISAARGEFIGLVDGDDWVASEMYEQLYRAAILRGAELAQCGYAEVFSDGSRLDYDDSASGGGANGFPDVTWDTISYLGLKPTVWRRIYRTDFVRQNKLEFPHHIRRFDDLPFQFEALSLAKRMAVIPDCYYHYRQGRPGQDIAVRDDRLFVHFDIFDWLRTRPMAWADARIEAQMVRVELNTHLWALGRIETKFKSEYLRRARAQLLLNRVHLGPMQLLRIAAQVGPRALRLVASAALSGLFGGRHSGRMPPTQSTL
ncbi:MAG: glycosyltransferase [Betaproteobacteria bacterium]|nr:glycosyltransferase [Betaproteobacteria bacterium]